MSSTPLYQNSFHFDQEINDHQQSRDTEETAAYFNMRHGCLYSLSGKHFSMKNTPYAELKNYFHLKLWYQQKLSRQTNKAGRILNDSTKVVKINDWLNDWLANESYYLTYQVLKGGTEEI